VQRAPLSVPRGFPPRTGVRNRGSALTLRSGPVFLVRIRAARECGGRGTTLLRDSRPFLTPLFTEVRGIGLLGTSDARSCVEPVLCRLSYVRGGGTVLACVHKKGRAGARVTLPDPCLPAQTRPPPPQTTRLRTLTRVNRLPTTSQVVALPPADLGAAGAAPGARDLYRAKHRSVA
jgi:hypothetical protein